MGGNPNAFEDKFLAFLSQHGGYYGMGAGGIMVMARASDWHADQQQYRRSPPPTPFYAMQRQCAEPMGNRERALIPA